MMRMRRFSAELAGIFSGKIVKRENGNGKSNRRKRRGFHSRKLRLLLRFWRRQRQRDGRDQRGRGGVVARAKLTLVRLDRGARAIETETVMALAQRPER